jgi:hypothetical protein
MLVLAMFFNISCATETQKPLSNPDIIQIQWSDLVEQDMFFTDNRIDSCRFVALETTDECLVGDIKKVEFADDLIFVVDYNAKLFVFDKNGKFLNTISSIGDGPNELLSFYDFYVNREAKYIGIFDILRNEIYHYSFDGMLLKKISCCPEMRGTSHIHALYDGKLIVQMKNNMENDFNYLLINEKDCSLFMKCLPYMVQGKKGIHFWPMVASSENSIYATSFLSDTVYHYTNNRLQAKYVFQPPLKKANKKIIKNADTDEFADNALTYLWKNGYSPGLFELYIVGNYLHFRYRINDKAYKIYWNIDDNKGYYTLWENPESVFELMVPIITTSNDAIVSVIQSGIAVEYFNTHPDVGPRVRQLMEHINEEDNPILAFYYIK